MTAQIRDHGGGIDAAIAKYGGTRDSWLDLSTGINPVAYPIPDICADAWTALPDQTAANALTDAARSFWNVPKGAGVLAAPGASSIIANIPALAEKGTVSIPGPTYNEHAAAFRSGGWELGEDGTAQVVVHPNNPDGRVWKLSELAGNLTIIDESFCDVMPEQSLIGRASEPGTIVLKSFGKFWGLAGLRLGFAIGEPKLIAELADLLGPWPVSGPALTIGTHALNNFEWAEKTRARLAGDAKKLDQLLSNADAKIVGGTTLFRLYQVNDAAEWQDRLAELHVWSRIFPYSDNWLRLGLPLPDRWDQLKAAL